jgi:signal transduction histidine kinase
LGDGSHGMPVRTHGVHTRAPEVLEHELRRLSARVEQLEHERGQLEDFAAMAAHELLKPLLMNESYASIISDRLGDALDFDTREDLEAMIRVSSRVRGLVEALLVDARESNRPLHTERVDLADVLHDCLRMLELEIRSREIEIEIAPMPVVEGDPALLSGVFNNLLINALKYGPRLGGVIRISADPAGSGWTFGVQSDGPALPEEARDLIFDAWQRGPGERRARGAGLGLAIVRHIVERHGGQVGVTSPSDSSNRFYFTLPSA